MVPPDPQPTRFTFPEGQQRQAVSVEHRPGLPRVTYHFHRQYELLLVRGGSGRRVIGDSVADFRGSQLVLVGPELAHSWVPGPHVGPGADFLVVVFSREALGVDLLARDDMELLARLLDAAGRGLVFPGDDLAGIEDRLLGMPTLPAPGKLLELLTVLERLSRREFCPLASERYARSAGQRDQENLHRALQLIHQSADEELTLAQAARSLHMSVSTFTRFFRRSMGTSFVQYRNEWRIRRACALLAQPDLTITQVSQQAGFGNLSHFNRQFRRIMQATPREYRRALGAG